MAAMGGITSATQVITTAAVVTRGPDGVVIHDHDGLTAYPAQPVTVVDTTGAGDAFAAGFLRQIADGGTLEEAAAAGITWASAAVQSPASIPPPWQVCTAAAAMYFRSGNSTHSARGTSVRPAQAGSRGRVVQGARRPWWRWLRKSSISLLR
jgi:hypothetical protein